MSDQAENWRKLISILSEEQKSGRYNDRNTWEIAYLHGLVKSPEFNTKEALAVFGHCFT